MASIELRDVRKRFGGLEVIKGVDMRIEDGEFAVFVGAESGLLGDDDTDEAAAALEPGTSAALLVYENRWAAPFATAVRRGGGQLVASGRIRTVWRTHSGTSSFGTSSTGRPALRYSRSKVRT